MKCAWCSKMVWPWQGNGAGSALRSYGQVEHPACSKARADWITERLAIQEADKELDRLLGRIRS